MSSIYEYYIPGWGSEAHKQKIESVPKASKGLSEWEKRTNLILGEAESVEDLIKRSYAQRRAQLVYQLMGGGYAGTSAFQNIIGGEVSKELAARASVGKEKRGLLQSEKQLKELIAAREGEESEVLWGNILNLIPFLNLGDLFGLGTEVDTKLAAEMEKRKEIEQRIGALKELVPSETLPNLQIEPSEWEEAKPQTPWLEYFQV